MWGGCLFLAERFFKEEEEIGEGSGSGYTLNITDGFTDGIIPTVTPFAIISV